MSRFFQLPGTLLVLHSTLLLTRHQIPHTRLARSHHGREAVTT